MTDEIRSWYLDYNGSEYWISAEDGARLQELAKLNPTGVRGTFEFVPLDSTRPVVIQFGEGSSFTLTGSGDD